MKPWLVFGCCCLVSKSCLTFCDPLDCSSPGSFVHGISRQEWVTGEENGNPLFTDEKKETACQRRRHFLLQGISLTQELKPHILNWPLGPLPPSHPRKPSLSIDLISVFYLFLVLICICFFFFFQLPTESLFYRAILQDIIKECYGITKWYDDFVSIIIAILCCKWSDCSFSGEFIQGHCY